MTARTVIEHALRVYYADSRDPKGIVEAMLAKYDAERDASEKSIPGGVQPSEDGATHRHPRPCEFPTVLPCMCVRPGALPEASFIRAKQRALVAGFFRCVAHGHAAAAEQRSAA